MMQTPPISPQPIGDDGWCIVGGRIPDPDNPVLLMDCPSDGGQCDNCPYYTQEDPIRLLII
jgi:hypothetical protein